MNTVSISVDVWCDYDGAHPSYRVYVDSHMLTERTFIWESKNQYIREHIEVNVSAGSHWLSIENLNSTTSKFNISNVQVNGTNITAATNTTVKFVV